MLWDFGAKENIIRELTRRGCRVADLPAGTTAEEILAAQRLLTGGSDSVFGINSENTFRHRWKRYCEVNGLSYVPPYNLRHTFVSMAKTLPEGAVKPLVGHSRQMDTYGIYAHLIEGEEKETTAALESVLQKILR